MSITSHGTSLNTVVAPQPSIYSGRLIVYINMWCTFIHVLGCFEGLDSYLDCKITRQPSLDLWPDLFQALKYCILAGDKKLSLRFLGYVCIYIYIHTYLSVWNEKTTHSPNITEMLGVPFRSSISHQENLGQWFTPVFDDLPLQFVFKASIRCWCSI